MHNPEKQYINPLLSPYFGSPKAFHLEMPLYLYIDLSNELTDRQVREFLKFSGTFDAYCIWCEKESVFSINENFTCEGSLWKSLREYFIRISYACSRDSKHKYYIYYLKEENKLSKIGQYPSVAAFQIPQAEKYRKILGEKQYKEFTRAIGLKAHGVGIGSFVYLRRVFENLIEEAYSKACKENKEFPINEYDKSRMDEKIKMLKDYLPEFLVENRSLYSILSIGIHDLTEDECLNYFETIKIGIEQILDEKIIQKEKVEKAMKAREAIQKLHSELVTQNKQNKL